MYHWDLKLASDCDTRGRNVSETPIVEMFLAEFSAIFTGFMSFRQTCSHADKGQIPVVEESYSPYIAMGPIGTVLAARYDTGTRPLAPVRRV